MVAMDPVLPVRALTLLSGGLDSQLAVCVLQDQAIEVLGVCFESPFFGSAAARAAAERLRITLHVVDFTADILALLDKPPHGFGSCLNPCIDCHARMLQRAGDMLASQAAQFLSTGEVLDERPMSQNRRSLETVARASGYADRVVRPLSAGLLPETLPERAGWVDRSRLLSLRGRGRKPQMELAARFGLEDYPSPAGGCLLTEPNFCRRLRDLKEHEGLGDVRAIGRLRVGRHFRLAGALRLVVGRNERENAALEASAQPDELVVKTEGVPGPTAILPAAATVEQRRAAGAVCARYSDAHVGQRVTISLKSLGGVERMEVTVAAPDEADRLRIG
jgi:tRNA U34 2-thiouridine synthase MnmA/TrmU